MAHTHPPEGEHPWHDTIQVILLLFFLIVWTLDSFFLHLTDQYRSNFPLWLRLGLAVGLGFVGFPLARRSLRQIFGNLRQTEGIVQDGVYKYIRHPMYLAAVLFYLAMSIATTSLIGFGLFICITLYYLLMAAWEERFLLKKYGDEYRTYMQKTGRMTPKVLGKKRR